jgi:hypothetical protein
MSIDLVGSLVSINRSDASSRTESDESTPPRPEQHDDMAQSPFVPQRARLMPGGPPVYLDEPLHIDLPQFLVDPDCRAVPGISPPGDTGLNLSFCSTSNSPEFLGSAWPIGIGPATHTNATSTTFHPDIDALEATLLCLKRQSIDLDRPHVHSRMSPDHMLADSVVLLRRAALEGKSEFYSREIDPIPQPLTYRVGG